MTYYATDVHKNIPNPINYLDSAHAHAIYTRPFRFFLSPCEKSGAWVRRYCCTRPSIFRALQTLPKFEAVSRPYLSPCHLFQIR